MVLNSGCIIVIHFVSQIWLACLVLRMYGDLPAISHIPSQALWDQHAKFFVANGSTSRYCNCLQSWGLQLIWTSMCLRFLYHVLLKVCPDTSGYCIQPDLTLECFRQVLSRSQLPITEVQLILQMADLDQEPLAMEIHQRGWFDGCRSPIDSDDWCRSFH